MEHLPGGTRGFQIFTPVVSQTEIQALSGHRLFDRVGMPVKEVADCGPNEVGAVRVEPVLHHQVYLAEVDIAEVDRNLLAVADFGSQFMHVVNHPYTIHLPSVWMVYGERAPVRQGPIGA